MPNPPLAVWIPILMNVVALLQCVLAATSFAEATAVKKNAKGAKELGVGFAPSVCTLSAPCDLFLAWRTGDTGEQLLFSPASPALPAKLILLLPRDMCGVLVKDNKMTNCGSMMARKMT